MKICVIIPCFNVKSKILGVLNKIDIDLVDKILLVDDKCPQKSGAYVNKYFKKKTHVIFKKKNSGVGGATITGFKYAIKENYHIVIKIDGDGQHDPNEINKFINALKKDEIDFVKGNRFQNFKNLNKIPKLRLFGNIILTFLTKINCRNFSISDALNGYLGIKVRLLKKINLDEISKDFFFEEDLLFKVSLLKTKIFQVPIKTIYFGKSNLIPVKVILPFLIKHFYNFFLRIKYDIFK
tara:strand:- start:120 stop:833 length:714 start_codon:yes stop_codon:yes gene_type:complete